MKNILIKKSLSTSVGTVYSRSLTNTVTTVLVSHFKTNIFSARPKEASVQHHRIPQSSVIHFAVHEDDDPNALIYTGVSLGYTLTPGVGLQCTQQVGTTPSVWVFLLGADVYILT